MGRSKRSYISITIETFRVARGNGRRTLGKSLDLRWLVDANVAAVRPRSRDLEDLMVMAKEYEQDVYYFTKRGALKKPLAKVDEALENRLFPQ